MSSALLMLVLVSGAATPSFEGMRAMPAEEARAKVEAWLKQVGKADAAGLDAIWKSNRALVEKVADGLALGDAEIAKLLAEVRNPLAPAPQAVPALLSDAKRPTFVRANVALAYAKALSQRRVYEEALATLQAVRIEDVVEPATYLFHQAVAQHGTLQYPEAFATLERLLNEAGDIPDRYLLVARLMHEDLRQWRGEDLASIAREMSNIERRLELARGGPRTREMQRDVVAHLDEVIRRLEERRRPPPPDLPVPSDEPAPPGPGPNGPQAPRQPKTESTPGDESGPGEAAIKKFTEATKPWGKLNEKERVKVITELIRDLPPGSRQMVEDYFRKLAQSSGR